jgi:predicted nucleic acid-binding protein
LSTFVLDCSVTASWCFEDEAEGYADRVLESIQSNEALVPQLWLLELGNTMVMAERTDRLTEKETVRFLSLVESLPIQVTQWLNMDLSRLMVSLAREHQLSVYDANYLWLAMEEDYPLATLDESLQKACERSGVENYDPTR